MNVRLFKYENFDLDELLIDIERNLAPSVGVVENTEDTIELVLEGVYSRDFVSDYFRGYTRIYKVL